MTQARSYADGKMLASVDDGVGYVTFNQPEKRNAMSIAMWTGLEEILDAFAADDGVRVVVLSGAGDKAFVSGADISQFEKSRSNADAQREYGRQTSSGRDKLAAFAKPVIARIRGFCLGGGLGIAMLADLRIAAEGSTFGIPAARLGIAYGPDMTTRLVDLVGPAEARMILYTGARIEAAEALRIGLVNRVVPAEALDATVRDLAATLAANAPLSLRASKTVIEQVGLDESARDVAVIEAAIQACFDSADYREGRTAFMEKRRPAFTGR